MTTSNAWIDFWWIVKQSYVCRLVCADIFHVNIFTHCSNSRENLGTRGKRRYHGFKTWNDCIVIFTWQACCLLPFSHPDSSKRPVNPRIFPPLQLRDQNPAHKSFSPRLQIVLLQNPDMQTNIARKTHKALSFLIEDTWTSYCFRYIGKLAVIALRKYVTSRGPRTLRGNNLGPKRTKNQDPTFVCNYGQEGGELADKRTLEQIYSKVLTTKCSWTVSPCLIFLLSAYLWADKRNARDTRQ